ncbi:Axial budding pattern protein 2 [Cytospora mali]|uniref:Axial budding pattern protein 2 n=1 Tax=Cytospora mali TaxID=578113 RepID=A0A194UQ91_CYTMA|nr:Axial budding pattern protein 2 [Valsa mali var. pyri (nom. inval.)]
MLMPDYLRTMLVSALACLFALPLAVRAKATSNFIDTISGYSELSTCAENVLSTIVRAQSSGCGDDGALTSYTCFCTDSSSLFSYEITSAISVSCNSSIWSTQATSAIAVFDAYCALGVPAALASTTAAASTVTVTGSPSPAATALTTSASATSMPAAATSAASNSSSSSSSSKTVAIAVGVAVPCGVIGLALTLFLLWRRRRTILKARSEKQQQIESTPGGTGINASRPEFRWPSSIAQARELPTQLHHAHEISGKEEIDSPNSSSFQMSPTHVYQQPIYQVQTPMYQHQTQQHQQWTPVIYGQERYELPGSS